MHMIFWPKLHAKEFFWKRVFTPLEDFETYSIRKYFIHDTDATFNIYI